MTFAFGGRKRDRREEEINLFLCEDLMRKNKNRESDL